MATLQEYLSQVTKDYEPTRQSIQNQIDAIPGQQQTAVADINRQFGLQQDELNRQQATAYDRYSKSAAARGGAFSGMANIQNKNYNENTFRPAVTQLQTNQQSTVNQANETYANRRFSLENTLNSLINEQQQIARNMYQADQDRQAQERAARAAAAAQSAALGSYFGPATQPGVGQMTPDFRQWLAASPSGIDPRVAQAALQVMGKDGKAGNYWTLDALAPQVGKGPSVYGVNATGRQIGDYLYNMYRQQFGV